MNSLDINRMNVEFRDICGNSFVLQIPDNATVADACFFLSQKTNVNRNQILLVSSDENMNFYKETANITDILKSNQDYIIFMKHLTNYAKNPIISGQKTDITQNNSNHSDFVQKQELNILQDKQLLSNSFFNTLQSINDWQYDDIYDEYLSSINGIPLDLQDRIDQIAEFGYSLDDIKEALRITNYDVLVATHLLVLVNSQENIENIMNELGDEYESVDVESETEIENHIKLSEFEDNYEKDN